MIEFKVNGNELLCSFHAHLGATECKDIDEKLAENMEATRATEIVFDMNGVEYISSAFLRICLMTAKKTGKGKFQITNAMPAIKKVFKMANLENALNVQ